MKLKSTNRVDDIVVFHRLDKTHMLAIVDIQLEEFASRLADQRIGFKASDEAKNALVEEGYDPVYGARPLKRTITRRLENPVSRLVVSGELAEGKDLHLGYDGTKREFTYEIR
jgi:ATP-dependent Clp protease ATP-binding subunit ClpB